MYSPVGRACDAPQGVSSRIERSAMLTMKPLMQAIVLHMLQIALPCASGFGKSVARRFGELGQELDADKLLHREGLENLVQYVEAQHREAVDAAVFFERVEKILPGALRLPHGRRRSKLRHMAEDFKEVVGEFFVVGIVQGLRRVITGALPRRVAQDLLREGENPLPELGVLVVAADLLEPPGHDAAERAAHRAAKIQLEGQRHMDQGAVPGAEFRPATVLLAGAPRAERGMLRHAIFLPHTGPLLDLFPDKAPIAVHDPRRILGRAFAVFHRHLMDAEDLDRKRVDMKPVGGQRLLRRGQELLPKARLHRPKLQSPLCLRYFPDIFRVGRLRMDYLLDFRIAHCIFTLQPLASFPRVHVHRQRQILVPDMHHQVFFAKPRQRVLDFALVVFRAQLFDKRRFLPHGTASAVQIGSRSLQTVDGVLRDVPHIVNVNGFSGVFHIEPLQPVTLLDPLIHDFLHTPVAFALLADIPVKPEFLIVRRLEDVRRTTDELPVRVDEIIAPRGAQAEPVLFRVLRVLAVTLEHDMDDLVRRRQVHDLRQQLRHLGEIFLLLLGEAAEKIPGHVHIVGAAALQRLDLPERAAPLVHDPQHVVLQALQAPAGSG